MACVAVAVSGARSDAGSGGGGGGGHPGRHKVLDVSGLDRIYLNGYVPGLMTSGQLVGFLVHWVPRSLPRPRWGGTGTPSGSNPLGLTVEVFPGASHRIQVGAGADLAPGYLDILDRWIKAKAGISGT